jgi:hypothetical protein
LGSLAAWPCSYMSRSGRREALTYYRESIVAASVKTERRGPMAR